MVNQVAQCFTVRRVWLVVVVGLLVHQTTARYVFEECPGVMGNRALHGKVTRVCEDCYNVFRDTDVLAGCRKGCFSSEMFKLCLLAMERVEEFPDFKRWIGILNAGR
uniref:Molt-inhibiting hormone n=1 Tax=Faxonius limosus TaxID=28379 RepID=MIH_FAXLI|nr:RecName: Full=Molt-inhibiting hormone; Short=MIH; Flags: Precursor [Faxonius limosus]